MFQMVVCLLSLVYPLLPAIAVQLLACMHGIMLCNTCLTLPLSITARLRHYCASDVAEGMQHYRSLRKEELAKHAKPGWFGGKVRPHR